MYQLNSVTDAFVLRVGATKFTCIRKDVLYKLRQLGDLGIYVANESLGSWGYEACDIVAELASLSLDSANYRYRDEAPLNTEQLQALLNLYLSFTEAENYTKIPTII